MLYEKTWERALNEVTSKNFIRLLQNDTVLQKRPLTWNVKKMDFSGAFGVQHLCNNCNILRNFFSKEMFHDHISQSKGLFPTL